FIVAQDIIVASSGESIFWRALDGGSTQSMAVGEGDTVTALALINDNLFVATSGGRLLQLAGFNQTVNAVDLEPETRLSTASELRLLAANEDYLV
uniref:hypothetical protein n=1 Tax=Janibacter hoylei TaxID=364298 RepID=UPI00248FD187